MFHGDLLSDDGGSYQVPKNYMKKNSQLETFTPSQVAEILKVGKLKVLSMIHTGELKGSKLGHRTIRVSEVDLQDYYDRNRIKVRGIR